MWCGELYLRHQNVKIKKKGFKNFLLLFFSLLRENLTFSDKIILLL